MNRAKADAALLVAMLIAAFAMQSMHVMAAVNLGHQAANISSGTTGQGNLSFFEPGNYSFTGNLTIGSPSAAWLFVNNASGRVGIGTYAPSNLLTVLGDANITGNISIADGSTLSPGLSFSNENGSGLYWSSAGDFSFKSPDVNTNRLRFTATNGVNSVYVYTGYFYLSYGNNGAFSSSQIGGALQIYPSGGDQALYLNGSGTTSTIVANSNTSLRFASYGGAQTYSPPGNTAASFIFETDTNTYLGIGTTSPNGTLHVSNAGNLNALVVNDTTGRVGIGTRSPAYALEVMDTAANGLTANISNVLYVNASSGRVGIRTSSPSYGLDVQGNASFNGTLTVAGGNVWIGATQPAFKLTVVGNIGPNESPVMAATNQTHSTLTGAGVIAFRTLSIAVGLDGFPVVVYSTGNGYDSTNGYGVGVVKCGNADCSAVESYSVIDSPAKGVDFPSLAIGADGFPIISYRNGSSDALKVAKCNDAGCNSTAVNITVVEQLPGVALAYGTSIAIGADGLPIIVYGIKVAKCKNAYCTASNITTLGRTDTNGGGLATIVIAPDGLPFISYYPTAGGSPNFGLVKCANASCVSNNNNFTLFPTLGGARSSVAIGADGLPVVSVTGEAAVLVIIKCFNATCTYFSNATVDSTGNVGNYNSIAIGIDGLPVVSYYDQTNAKLKVLKCGNLNCSAGNTLTTVLTAHGDSGAGWTSIAVPPDGLPIIGLMNPGNYLGVVKCANPACSAANSTALTGGQMLGGWAANPRSYGVPYRAISTLAVSNPTTFTNLSFLTAGSEKMTITPYGDIGIGTQAPKAKLHISGSSLSWLSMNVSGDLYVQRKSSEDRVGIATPTPAYTLEVKDTAASGLTANISNALYVNASTGSISINTTFATQAVHVAGTLNITGNITMQSPNSSRFTCGVDTTNAFRCGFI